MAAGCASSNSTQRAATSAMSTSASDGVTTSPQASRWRVSHWPTNPLLPVISARTEPPYLLRRRSP